MTENLYKNCLWFDWDLQGLLNNCGWCDIHFDPIKTMADSTCPDWEVSPDDITPDKD